jgi:hypothetical protein
VDFGLSLRKEAAFSISFFNAELEIGNSRKKFMFWCVAKA